MIRNLGEGLLLRRATPSDLDKLTAFNARVHSDAGWDVPDAGMAAWAGDLLSERHPTCAVDRFLIVEDREQGAIASSSVLIPQTWSYAGTEFGVGRPELIGTHPDYRHRGLVRVQLEVLHRWSLACGHRVQAITGIPWYYRQFGYEMTVDMHGGRRGPVSAVPMLEDGQKESFQIRAAAPTDLSFIAEVAAQGGERDLLNCVRDASLWRYELDGQTSQSVNARQLHIIEGPQGDRLGFLAHPGVRWGGGLHLTFYELRSGVSWWAVTPPVLRYLKRAGESLEPYGGAREGGPPFDALVLSLGREHPAYQVVEEWLPKVDKPYAWYLRVPDLPGYLRPIAGVLEQRLATSILVGHTGTLRLDFYRDGVNLVFERGRLVDVVPWTLGGEGDSERKAGRAFMRFPDLTFLQVLFGYRSLDELAYAHADCGGNLEGRLLVKALFPKRPSTIWPIS